MPCPERFFEKPRTDRVGDVEVEVGHQDVRFTQGGDLFPTLDARDDQAAAVGIDSGLFVHVGHIGGDKVRDLAMVTRVQLDLERRLGECLDELLARRLAIRQKQSRRQQWRVADRLQLIPPLFRRPDLTGREPHRARQPEL